MTDRADNRILDALGLATPSATRAVLEAHGLDPKRRLGQNFLVSRTVLERILRRAELGPGDVVLEVGPGIGTLTRGLLAEAGAVVAIEADASLLPVLRDTCADGWDRLAIVRGDAVRVTGTQVAEALRALDALADAGAEPMPDKLVSNLPYSVAATVVLDAFAGMPSVGRAVVMVQREVADRMAAEPGTKAYGAYTAKLALHARVVGRFEVGRREFWPQPHVDSTVVTLVREPLVVADEAERVADVIDGAFAQRRKTLANSLSRNGFAREAVEAALDAMGLDPMVRAERLAPGRFVELSRILTSEVAR